MLTNVLIHFKCWYQDFFKDFVFLYHKFEYLFSEIQKGQRSPSDPLRALADAFRDVMTNKRY